MNITAEKIMAGTFAFGTVSFTTYKFIELRNKKKAAEAIESLTDHINLDVTDPYIKEYIEKAVDKEVCKAVSKACDDVVSLQKNVISTAVSAEVKKQKDIIAGSVKTAIANKVGQLNIEDVKKEALADAKEMAVKKLRKDMDDILENYKQGLDNMATIYNAISEKTSKQTSFPGWSFDISM